MQAIILAGGFGTRLQSIISEVPKPMAPINNRPFLEYILDELNNAGFSKVIIAVGYKKESIINYFQNKFKNISIIYSIENEPLGTGGSIQQALNYVDEEFVFVLNGDTMFKINFSKMVKINSLAIACKKMNRFNRYGEVIIRDNKIIDFSEKKYVEEGYINGGIYYIPKNLFVNFPMPKVFSIEKDFFQQKIDVLNINAFTSEEYFIDIGIPDDYKKAQSDFKKKALFLDRDGIINVDFGHVYKIEDFKFTDFIFDLCKEYSKKGYLIVVITNQAGIAKKMYSMDDVELLHKYMCRVFKEHGIDIAKVYYCPHKDDDNCECRKPKPGLYLDAIEEFSIDPLESVAIGDKLSDLQAAHEAGIKKLLYKKTKYDEYPVDFMYTKL